MTGDAPQVDRKASISRAPARSSRSHRTSRSASRRSSRWSTPTASSSCTASSELRDAAMADEVLADSVAGELIDTEIEIRSGRCRDLRRGDRAPERAPPAAVRRRPSAADRARDDRHPSVGELPRPADHRHRALQPAARGAALGRAAQQHLEPARARRGPRRRSRDRGLRPPARPAAAAAGGLRELAVPRRPGHRPALGAQRDLHPHLPALRGPRAVRRLERPTPTSSTC